MHTPLPHPNSRKYFLKCISVGALIAFFVIFLFLMKAENVDPAWNRFWMVRPLIIVPFAGAMGGLVFWFLKDLRDLGGWKKILAHVLSLVVYLIGLWMGMVLGLDGTYWD